MAEGRVDVERPVADYVPEFADNGKAAVTVEQVLLMTSGFPEAPIDPEEGGDRARRVAVVPQNLDRWPSLKVVDLVASGRYAHLSWWRGPGAADREAVEHALEQVGLAA